MMADKETPPKGWELEAPRLTPSGKMDSREIAHVDPEILAIYIHHEAETQRWYDVMDKDSALGRDRVEFYVRQYRIHRHFMLVLERLFDLPGPDPRGEASEGAEQKRGVR